MKTRVDEMFPAVDYLVLAQGGTWATAREPFLNPAASIGRVANGVTLRFGGIPAQQNFRQASAGVAGPWTDLAGALTPDASGTVQFTVIPAPAQLAQFYRARLPAPIY